MGTKLCDEDRIEAVSEMMVPFQIESEECQFGDGGAGDSHLGIELRIVGTMGVARVHEALEALRKPEPPTGYTAAMNRDDKKLGMGCPITRRDFLNGAAVGAGSTLLGGSLFSEALNGADRFGDHVGESPDAATATNGPAATGEYYPPAKMGMRGNRLSQLQVFAIRNQRT